MKASAKERLVETALRLFAQDGFHATGIDKILSEANVSKMTMYKYFPSKDALIQEVLRLRDERFRQWLLDQTQELADSPKARLAAVFDALDQWFMERDFHGCLFINATAEYGQSDHPVQTSAKQHKALVAAWLEELAAAAGIADPQALAWILMLLMEGAIVTRQVAGEKRAAKYAKQVAIRVISGAAGPSGL